MEASSSSSSDVPSIEEKINIFNLPVEILCNILRLLDGKSLVNASCSCSYWQYVCEGDSILRKRIENQKAVDARQSKFPKRMRICIPKCKRYSREWNIYKFHFIICSFFLKNRLYYDSTDEDSDDGDQKCAQNRL